MAIDRFLIGSFKTGLQTDVRPFQIPEEAFPVLQNAYVFRDRVTKRFGTSFMGTSQLTSRLRLQVGVTTSGALSGTVPGTVFAAGQLFSVGTQIFTVYQVPPVSMPAAMYATGPGTGTYDTTPVSGGAFAITGTGLPDNTPVYFYPATPVMGIGIYENGPINNQPSFAFDQQFVYQWSSSWFQSTSTTIVANAPPYAGFPQWHGTDSNFFWITNWQGITDNTVNLYVSNFFTQNSTLFSPSLGSATDDPIWYYDNTNWYPLSYSPNFTQNPWNLQPLTVTSSKAGNTTIIGNYVQSALIVEPFKNRLVLLNTIENNANGAIVYVNTNQGDRQVSGITPTTYLTSTNTQYVNRCRYSHNGSPLATNAWLEPNQVYNPVLNQLATNTAIVYPNTIADGGGYIDAPTSEAIVSAEFIKDRLIVAFQSSTYELAYTGSEVLPFIWQKINTEFGSESTFGSVPFDQYILFMGNAGVLNCTGNAVGRIDEKIPDEIWDIKNASNGIARVVGIRDYFAEQVYWCFPNDSNMGVYPNQILQYNYRTNTWALLDDSFTFFGYFVQQSDLTWQTATDQWQNYNQAWNAGVNQQKYKQILAGNQEGFVLVVNPELSHNAGSLQITNIVYTNNFGITAATITAINHNLPDTSFVLLENIQGITNANGYIYKIGYIDANTFMVFSYMADPINQPAWTGAYTGGGTIARVSNLNIYSKQWNPYLTQGRNFYLSKIDFCVANSESKGPDGLDLSGEVTIDYFTSSAQLSLVKEATVTGAILGDSTLATGPYPTITYEAQQDFLWHPVYLSGDGEFVQIRIYMSDIQMLQPSISLADFELDSLVLFVSPSSSRLQ